MSGVVIFINKRGIAPIVLAESIPSYVVGRIAEQTAHPFAVGARDVPRNAQVLVPNYSNDSGPRWGDPASIIA